MRYQPQKTNHLLNLISVFSILGIAFAGFNYFATKHAAATGDPLVTADTAGGSTAPLDSAQLELLRRIDALKLDGSILKDPIFLNLRDWTVDLGHIDAGRVNPFISFITTQAPSKPTPAPKGKTH